MSLPPQTLRALRGWKVKRRLRILTGTQITPSEGDAFLMSLWSSGFDLLVMCQLQSFAWFFFFFFLLGCLFFLISVKFFKYFENWFFLVIFGPGIFHRSETGLLTSTFSLQPSFDEQLLHFNLPLLLFMINAFNEITH